MARRLIDGPASPIARLAADHEVEALAFARETAPASLPALAESLKIPAKTGDSSLSATDWEPVLARALQSDGSHATVTAVVLLTDGRRNGPIDPLPAIDRLAARGVPVYSILIGSTLPPRDAAVAAVKAPETVYRGDVATVSATIKVDGYPGQTVAVTLDRPGASPLRQTLKAPASAAAPRPVVSFAVPLDQTGQAPLSIAVEPLPGDVRPDNDRHTISIQVIDDKVRLLLVDGEPRWEFQYLRNALKRDTRIDLRTVVFNQTPATASLGHAYESSLPPRGNASRNEPDPLGSFDAIILGDVSPDEVPADLWARFEAFVAGRGGTLVLMPARGTGPRTHARKPPESSCRCSNHGSSARTPPLRPPIRLFCLRGLSYAHWTPSASAIPGRCSSSTPTPSETAPPGPVCRACRGSSRAGRSRVQLHLRPPAATTRPSSSPRSPTAWGKSSGSALMGPGVSGSAWATGFITGSGARYARWAASGALAAGNAFVRFGPTKPRFAEGDAVKLQARLSEGIAGAGPDLLIAARIFRADPKAPAAAPAGAGEPIAIVPLYIVAGQPRTFGGEAASLPPGSYVMRLDVPQLAQALELDAATNPKVPEAAFEVVSARELGTNRTRRRRRSTRATGLRNRRPRARRPRRWRLGSTAASHQETNDARRGNPALGSAGLLGAILWHPYVRVGREEEAGAAVKAGDTEGSVTMSFELNDPVSDVSLREGILPH